MLRVLLMLTERVYVHAETIGPVSSANSVIRPTLQLRRTAQAAPSTRVGCPSRAAALSVLPETVLATIRQ